MKLKVGIVGFRGYSGAELVKTQIITKQTFEQRKRNFESADAALKNTMAQRDQALSAIKSAQAQVERIESILSDLNLVSPRLGRVQYQLARAGEVIAAGAPVVTILDLTDVYMTIFLPGTDAAKLEIGGEARGVGHCRPISRSRSVSSANRQGQSPLVSRFRSSPEFYAGYTSELRRHKGH